MIQKKTPIAAIVSLFGILFLIVMSFTITSIASPYIVSDLGGDRTITSYALSYFGFGTAITIPLAQPLAVKFGEKKFLLSCILAFSLAAFLCGIASTYFFLLSGRFLQGMASGPFYPLLVHFFSVLVPPNKKIAIVWTFVTILVVVPVIGASLGGVVAYLYNWRAFFFFTAAAGTLLAAFAKICLEGVEPSPLKGRFDWIGWIFYAIGIFCLSFAVANAQQLDWYRSPLLLAAALIGLPSFGYYLLRSFTHETPVMDLTLFGKPVFSLAILCLAVLFGVYFGMILLFAIWLTIDVRFTPIWIGILLGHMGIAGLFPRFIIEERMGKIDPRIWIAIATLLLAISCFYTTIFNPEINFGRIAFSRILAGFGLALFLPPVFQILSQCHAPARWIDVFEVFQSVRNISCGLSAAIFSIAWQRRTVFYHERLGEKLYAQSNAVETFLNRVDTLRVPGKPLAQLNDFLDTHASSLALNDVFYLMGWILTGLLVLLIATFIFKPDSFDISKAKYPSEN